MKLLTKEILKRLPKLYKTEEVPTEEKVVIVNFFQPWGSWTWYATEFDSKQGLFFGWQGKTRVARGAVTKSGDPMVI